jgi:tRNA uridine 5-carboxymethylaminomethyl modification enzyme
MEPNRYDVIVTGAGHAGCEAALAAARMGARTACFTLKLENVGRMSCNPSLGGPAKGHLAREIDALGGEMGRVADLTGIQFRMLNRGKGPAVWAPRSQNDRQRYGQEMRRALEEQPGLDLIEADIVDLIVVQGEVRGVRTRLGEEYHSPRVIIAGGTFGRGRIHVGDISYPGGRSGEPSSEGLSEALERLGIPLRRFKTGTPPRIDLRTVDFSAFEEQPGDEPPEGFSFYRDIPLSNQVSCWLGTTTPETHRIIRVNLKRSALYGGYITGTGPRYCPSIEDKVVKFADKERHQVFIEPEGTQTVEAYLNGVSNSLPPDVQTAFVHSIPGLERARILRYAYAIEYDVLANGELTPQLESRRIRGLYFAGQINGTSGYEEAGAQGIAAGISAVLTLGSGQPLILPRSESYIGVLVDDLVTRGTDEPYRMFTSRSEFRLALRQDNADERLMPLGRKLGLVSEDRWSRFTAAMEIFAREMAVWRGRNNVPTDDIPAPTRLATLLKRPGIDLDDLPRLGYAFPADVDKLTRRRIRIACKYEGYLIRQREEADRFGRLERWSIPADLDYMVIATISYEAREKLAKHHPGSIGQAARISGVNRTDLLALTAHLKKLGVTG